MGSSQVLYDFKTMDEVVGEATSDRRFALILIAAFASTALILASIGIYGVMSYSVLQRSQEIGIRMALGARRNAVLAMVMYGGARLTLMGVVIGSIAAVGLTRFINSFLYGVRPSDPVTFLVVAAFLAGVALTASYVPARRATRVDPLSALRSQ
jgi:ABC-type antimicrobial peptide transport system permease subunit